MKGTGFSIRRAGPPDASAIADLMNRAFDGEFGPFMPCTTDWWHWKYASNPAGPHGLVVEDADGRIVGHYGGVPISMYVDGSEMRFGQNCDSCSDPSVRRGLRNPGMFVRLGQAYASTYGAPGEDAIMYGLPNRRVFRIGNRYLDYWILRQQWFLFLDGSISLPEQDPGVTVEVVDGFDARADHLFERLAARYRCVGRRDARFLNWRFRDAPGSPYRMAVARRGDDHLCGYAVWRDAEMMGRRSGILLDWFADPADLVAAGALMRGVAERLAEEGLEAVLFVCPTSSEWFEVFQTWGYRVVPSPYMMTARPYSVDVEPEYLREHWYYTLADFDAL